MNAKNCAFRILFHSASLQQKSVKIRSDNGNKFSKILVDIGRLVCFLRRSMIKTSHRCKKHNIFKNYSLLLRTVIINSSFDEKTLSFGNFFCSDGKLKFFGFVLHASNFSNIICTIIGHFDTNINYWKPHINKTNLILLQI